MIFNFFENLIKPFPIEEPKEPPKTLFAFCQHYTKGVWLILFIMSFMTTLISIIEVNLFAFLGNVIDWLSIEKKQFFWKNNSNKLILISLLILIVLPIIIFIQSALKHQALLSNYPMIIRWQAHRYILKQSLNFFNNDFAGRIGSKVMQTSLAVREVVMTLLDVIVYVSVYFISILIILGSANVNLMIPLILWLLFYLGLLYYYVPRLQEISQNQANARSIMTGRVVDSYSNIMTVKLFSHSNMEADYAKVGMGIFLKTVYSQMRKVTEFQTLLYINNMLILFVISFIALNFWQNELISMGIVAVSISLVIRLNGLSQWIMWEVSRLFENIGTLQDGINTFSQAQEIQDKTNSVTQTINMGNINFKNITFNYGKKIGIIDGLSLNIKHGEKIGLVGRSGAGKSTLINLLLRLYDLEDGKILINGYDLLDLQQDVLRKHIGVVAQDTSLFHRTVAENIAYGIKDVTKEKIISAAKRANAHEFILELVDINGQIGYDALVGERGIKLSGGQRQRIAISRVFLKNAPILVLDEATSALDSEVESAIQDNLLDLMDGKTVITIAHRLSTISALDRLIVLDKGKIVEDGTHQELIDFNGIYAYLWKHQSGGFLIEK